MRAIYITAQAVGCTPATVGGKEAGWRSSVQVPTFVLDADIQGITTPEHAEQVAKKVIDPLGLLEVHVVVTMPGEGP